MVLPWRDLCFSVSIAPTFEQTSVTVDEGDGSVQVCMHFGGKGLTTRGTFTIRHGSARCKFMLIKFTSGQEVPIILVYEWLKQLSHAVCDVCCMYVRGRGRGLRMGLLGHPIHPFFLNSSAYRLVQNCMTLYDSFCTKQQHFTPSSAPAHCFFTTEELWLHYLQVNFLHLYTCSQIT